MALFPQSGLSVLKLQIYPQVNVLFYTSTPRSTEKKISRPTVVRRNVNHTDFETKKKFS